MTLVTIGNSVPSIGDSTFYNCTSLTSVTIGNSVTSIGEWAFRGCTGLTSMTFLGLMPPQYNDSYYYHPFNGIPANIPVYIPCGRLAYYAAQMPYFTNYVETAFGFSAVSDDESTGTVQILTMPSCTNNNAVLYATPADGYRFDHWSTGSTDNPYTLIVTSDTTITAFFEAISTETYTVTVVAADPATGSVTGGGTFEYGTSISITATPADGYRFDHWSTGSIDNPYTLTVIGDITIMAYFAPDGGGTEGIDEVEVSAVKLNQRDGRIVVEGAEGQRVMVFDAVGRVVAESHPSTPTLASGHPATTRGSARSATGTPLLQGGDDWHGSAVSFEVPTTGVYLVKVGDAPARRIVVVR